MTDLEAAKLIASCKGWVKWAKEHWVWAVGDWFWYNNKPNLVSEYMLKKRHSDGKEFPTIDSILNSMPTPIPSGDQLMDMLEAKGFLKISIDKYITVKKDKEEEVLYACWIRGYFDELPINFTVEAPTRPLVLFAAVCKVYGLNRPEKRGRKAE